MQTMTERLEQLDIYETWHGLRAISPAKVLKLVDSQRAEIDRLNRELVNIGLNRNVAFGPRSTGLPFTHWSKDPLIPYANCECSSCSNARRGVFHPEWVGATAPEVNV